MKFYRINHKPYYQLKIFATLIDYSIFILMAWIFLYCFGVHNPDDDSYKVEGPLALVTPLIWFLYFVVTEATNQATPGHDICGLKVYSKDGHKPTLIQALKRRLCDIIDISFWGIPAFICIANTPNHQRIGDLWAGTVVAKKIDLTETEVTF